MDLELAICYTLIRIGIPILLLFVVCIRQNLLSAIYLVFLLVGPYLPYSSARSLTKGHVGIYLKILIIVSSLICVAQIVFQIVLLVSVTEYRSTLDYCSPHGFLLNSIGLNRLDDVSIFEILRLVGLDFVVFFFSASVFLATEHIYAKWAVRLAARRAGHRRDSISRRNQNETETRAGDTNDAAAQSPVRGSTTTPGQSSSQTASTICESQILNDRDSTVDGNTDLKDIQRIERYRLRRQKALETIKLISEIIFVILLCGAGILNPSLTSSIYFISFLSIVTLVSCNKKLGKLFVQFKLFLCIILISHLTALFLYQMDWFRIHVPPTSLGIRLFGLRPYVQTNCTTARELHFENLNWNIYAHPFFLVILYILSGSFVRAEIFHRTKIYIDKLNDLVEEESEVVGYTMPLHDLAPFKTESTPLLSGTEPKRYQALQEQPSAPRAGLEMDPHGSLTWRNDTSDGVSVTSSAQKTAQQISPTSPNPTTVDRSQRWAPILYLMNLIKRGSYALTLIVMMTWSITYHSWLGFTLLLWSCVIWMMPNSRQACLKSSLCLVIYAILLLLSQYIFSLDLREDELPQFIGTVNLNEIGLKKYFDLSYKPLALKTLFTCMFWITLRQYSEERALARWNQDRDRSISTNRGSQGRPSFQRHMSLASAVLPHVSPNLLILSNFIRGLFIKYWIWVVAIMLMVMSLGGDRVVIYRIVYMSLFLSFIFVFQLSFKLWRKFMYPFWLVVIIYSMTVLIAIYTYQFQHFARYWQDYFRLSKEMQAALGLKLYGADPWVLFKELFTPTFFLIITIIQLRFWHKDFLLFTRCDLLPERREESYTTSSTAPTAGPSTSISTSTTTRDIKIDMDSSDITVTTTTKYTGSQSGTSQSASSAVKSGKSAGRTATTTTSRGSIDGIENLLKPESKKKRIPRLSVSFLSSKLRLLSETVGPSMKFCHQLMWRLLEIHLMKVVLLVSIIAALNEVSLANVAFVIFISIAIPLTHIEKFISYLIGSWASVLILTKMVYQIPTVYSSTTWISNCSSDIYDNSSFPVPSPIDNRLYLGFKEVANDQVFNYIKLDLFVTLMLTVNSIVCIRQQIHRQQKRLKPLPPGIAVLGVKRHDAESGFFGLSRYLINYFFYKFGLELTCFVIVIAIQGRQDIVSCLYAVSLITFTMCPRNVINRLWPYFLGFLCIFLPIEYISSVGLPPGFCFNYPWEGLSVYFSVCREWLFLPDFVKPPNAQKLFYDFFVLLLAGRQYIVFKIERRPDAFHYDGGDNIDLGSEDCTSSPDFADFFTFTNTIFDHTRSLFFTSFVWITLAVVFLTAMTPDNLFGVGYIIGCFIFLWMGSDIYLRQQRNIVLAWKILIFYNLFVILSKTILQILGCAYQKELLTNYCWAVKLMGIVCNAGLLEPANKYTCTVDTRDKVQLTMDCLCFCFLIAQKRIFCSHYFKFLVKEIWAQTTLASRGAQLIHEVQLKEVREQENAEREVMEKIKAKMDRIRANQQASLGAKQDKIKYHYQAIKSGDYYMFDEPDLEVIDFNEKTRRPQIPDPVGDELDRIANLHGVTAFCSILIKGQSAQSEIEQRRKIEDVTDVGESSKDSAIISVDREKEVDRESSATTQYSSLPPTSTIPESPEEEGSSTISIESESKKLPKDDEKADENGSESNETDDGQCESIIRKIEWCCKLISLFFKSLVISMTAKLNSVSRDYRFVSRRLEIERKALKRLIIDDDYDRDPDLKRETLEIISKASYTDLNRISNSPRPVLIRDEFFQSILPREDHEAPSEDKLTTPDPFLEANFFIRFLWSLFYAVISHSEFLCYFLVILNQLINASLLSMPLPLMVFLWGCLSVPRPTRTFWLYVITYTELVIISKYMFSFKVWSWMSGPPDDDPFWPPRMFGIADIDPVTHQIREGSKSKMDLVLLLCLFFHRFMLKSLGLWDLDVNYEFNKDLTKNRDAVSASGASRDELSKEPKTVRPKSRKISELYLRRRNVEESLDDNQHYRDDDPLDDKEIEMVQKLIEASENMHQKCWASVSPVRQFLRRILSPPFRIAKDYYAMMFFCDFINFFTVWFGYSSFGTSPGVGDITTYLQENRVPMPFLFMLLFQFGLIIIDRGLYLRKDIKKRLIFHIVIAIAMHIFLFLALPAFTRRSFTSPDNNAPKLWYICKSIYLLLSAWQVKSGYPTRILGNCFTKKYTFVNSSLFMLYMMVPFLYDMRLMMDWMWTDTSLGLNEWAIMEDINKQLFERKCELTFEENFPEPGSISRRRVPKYIRGGAYLLLMIGAIWFPLFIFALSGTIGQPNKPSDFAIEIEFSGYQPIFKMSSTNDALEDFDGKTFNALEQECSKHGWVGGQNLLSTYGYADAVKAKINGNSTATWGISPPSQRSLISKLDSDDPLLVKITYTVTRTASKSKTQNLDPSIYDSHTIEITKEEVDLRRALVEMLQQPENLETAEGEYAPAILKDLFPNYIKAPESGSPVALEDFGQTYRDVEIVLRKGRFENGSITQWWEISEVNCSDNSPFSYFDDKGEHCHYLTSVIFSDKIFPGPLLQLISGHGIFGLYTTFVFVVSRIIRSFFADMCTKVIYTQMPCVDRVLQLCLDIYLVRESREFGLEEDLYAKLIFLYRSPETLIKWTKPIEPAALPGPSTSQQQQPNTDQEKEDKDVDEKSDS